MKSCIFIAPPAGGKGTQSELVCKKYNVPHISTGDLLRNEVNCLTEIGKKIKSILDNGYLVSDEIVYDLLKTRLSIDDCKNGYVLDGFPRNQEQAVVYEEMLKELNLEFGCVILLDLPLEEAISRINGRISCPNCGATYNTSFENMKPSIEGICDSCNSPLVKREDDNIESYKTRYQTYLDKTEPLIDYYIKRGVLYKVDSTKSVEDVFKQVDEIIRGVLND